jgi:hypothetical protein
MESGFVWWCCYLVENLEGNDACFRRKFPGDFGNVIYRVCDMINSWAILQTNQCKKNLEDGVESR